MTTKKKPHWTQTPEGKRKLRKNMIAYHKGKKNVSTETPNEAHIAFAYGYCNGWLTRHAESTKIPKSILTERVAQLLLSS